MLAGMLNLLVIYDAWAGPLGLSAEEKSRRAAEAAGPADASSDGATASSSSPTTHVS
jgi:hypothetical protein